MKNILIADDVAGWLTYNRQNLLELYENAEIYAFSSAREAYDFAFTFDGRIDIVITDLQMENMEKLAGEWLVENLKTIKSTQLAKYFLVSSCLDIKYVAERVGANGYLRKPSYMNNKSMLQYMLNEAGENV
ncbi:MAG: response regulator [bacterium]|nr:response regulator [bacterium]